MAIEDLAIALVAPAGPDAETYRSRLAWRGAQTFSFTSLSALREGCAGLRLSGLAVDLACIASLPEDEKAFLAELVDSFPLVRLRRVGPPDEVAGTYAGKARAGDELLSAFFKDARATRPRGVRLEVRRDLVLGTILYPSERNVGGPGQRASISNLSRNGFFVVTAEPPAQGTCWLVIPRLGDEGPVRCEVRWTMPWGESMQMLPGFGVRCLSLTDQQRKTIDELLTTSAT